MTLGALLAVLQPPGPEDDVDPHALLLARVLAVLFAVAALTILFVQL